MLQQIRFGFHTHTCLSCYTHPTPKGGSLWRRDSEKKKNIKIRAPRRSERSCSSGRGVLRAGGGAWNGGLRSGRAKNSCTPLKYTSNRIYRPPVSDSSQATLKIKFLFNCQFRILLCSLFERDCSLT